MDAPLYPSDVVVTSTALQFGEREKAFHIQRRQVDTTRAGRASGLDISIGTPTSRFTIIAGHGYTSRGDYVEFDGVSNRALASYDTGVVNYFVLFYRETPGSPESQRTSGESQNTLTARSSELKVMTQDEFDALPTSEDADLATNLEQSDLSEDVQDRAIILAVVLGKGFTGATPNGYIAADFNNGNITQQATLEEILTAVLPTNPTVPGVNLKAISSDNTAGTGELTMVVTDATTKDLSWAAPGESAGATVSIDTTAVSEVLVLESDTAAKTITVEVFPSLIPDTATTYDDDVEVEVLYADDGPVFSSKDDLHRSKVGGYVPTGDNAHGTGYSNLAQKIANIPRPTMIGSDTLTTATEARQARITTPVADSGVSTRTHLWATSHDGIVTRFYYYVSEGTLEVTTNAWWNGTNWTRDDSSSNTHSTKLVFSSNGITQLIATASGATVSDADFKQTWISGTLETSTQALLALGASFLTGSDVHRPRIGTAFPSTTRTHVWGMTSTSAGTPGVRFYAEGSALIIAVNARWDGTNWTKDDTSVVAIKVKIANTGIVVQSRTGTGTWNDSQWTDGTGNLQYTAATGALVVSSVTTTGSGGVVDATGTVTAGSGIVDSSAGDQETARYNASVPIDPANGDNDQRWLIRETLDSNTTIGFREYAYMDSNEQRTELALGCHWDFDDQVWRNDTNSQGSATLLRLGAGYAQVVQQIHPSTPDSWADDEWTDVGVVLTSKMNPDDPTDGYKNAITGAHIAKAWGVITLTDVATTPVATLTDGINIASVAISGGSLLVTLEEDMATANGYHVSWSLEGVDADSQLEATEIAFVRVHTKLVGSFKLSLYTADSPPARVLPGGFDAGNEGLQVGFAVFGRQVA